jgi:hypothetical protein
MAPESDIEQMPDAGASGASGGSDPKQSGAAGYGSGGSGGGGSSGSGGTGSGGSGGSSRASGGHGKNGGTGGISLAVADPEKSILRVRRRPPAVAPPVRSALMAFEGDPEYKGKGAEAETRIASKGLSDTVEKVTARLTRAGLDDAARLLLADKNVYGALILHAIDKEKVDVDADDATGLFNSIVRNVDAPKHTAYKALLELVFAENRVNIAAGTPEFDRIAKKVMKSVSLTDPEVETKILEIQRTAADEGDLPTKVQNYLKKLGYTDEQLESTPIVTSMVGRLREIGINPQKPPADAELAPFLAVAYSQAGDGTDSASDPIVLAGAPGTFEPWNFKVERFETAEQQGVAGDNILAAGALDYVFNFDKLMGVFRLADALVLRWASGLLDIVSTDTSNKLYSYWKMRDRRIPPEERDLLYKRVLDKGEAEVLSRMVVNESYPRLWHNLMEKVAEYIEATEDAAKDTAVSKIPIYRATQDLQFNLTDHATGMVQMQVTEMYRQFEDAIELLEAPEIVSQLSAGRRKTGWAVIERLSREEFNEAPDVATIRTLAVEGNKVFEWIANFDAGSVREDDFQQMVEAAQNWIIAAAGMGDLPMADEPAEDEFGDEFGDSDDEEDW